MADVLFVMRMPLDGRDNLCAKFMGQIEAVKRLGHRVNWICWDHQGMWLCGNGEPQLLLKARLSGVPGYHHTFLYVDLMNAVRKLAASRNYDVVYMRYMPTFWNAPAALRALHQKGAKLIVEHPTYPFQHARSNSWLRRTVTWYTEKVFSRIHAMVDLYTIMGDDCGGVLEGRPAINIVNGVDVEALPLHVQPQNENEVHLLALASMSHWQGYDRLIRAMAEWKGQERVVLHLAGKEGDGSLAAWLKLAEELGVQENVTFEGELHGEALNALADRCDAGVGSLSIRKRKVSRVITLKLREYMARGLPFLYEMEDVDVPWPEHCSLQVADEGDPIDLQKVVEFARQVRTLPDLPRQMRSYAQRHLAWEPILESVLREVGIH